MRLRIIIPLCNEVCILLASSLAFKAFNDFFSCFYAGDLFCLIFFCVSVLFSSFTIFRSSSGDAWFILCLTLVCQYSLVGGVVIGEYDLESRSASSC